MFKILIISLITFMLVIIIFLIFMTFMNMDIKTNSKSIEKFYNTEAITITGGTRTNIPNTNLAYIIFNSNGTLYLPNSITNVEILVVGGGGSGGRTIGGGGGGGAVVHITNATINAGTYNIIIGQGGAVNTNDLVGNKGSNSSFAGIVAEGGGASSSYPNNGGSGGSGGGSGADEIGVKDPIGGLSGSQSSLGGFTGTIYKNSGGDGLTRTGESGRGGYLGGGGGGGAGERGLNGNPNYNGNGGKGGNGIQINITGTNLYWGAGGGGAQYNSSDSGKTSRGGNGGLGGGGGGSSASGNYGSGGTNGLNNGTTPTNQIGGNGGANTGSGGGGGGWVGSQGGAGGSGIVIIRFIRPEMLDMIQTTYEESIINKNTEFIENNKKYIYNTKYDSSINIENQNISLVEKNPNRIIRSSTFPTIFPPNRYINGYFKENGDGELLIIVFKDPFVLKKITFVADNDLKTAPASCDIYYIENREPLLIKNIIATYEDYSEFEGKSQNTCIKFFIDNNLNVDKYLIVFKSVLGGTELKFNKIILYEGIIPKVNILSSAGSSIQKNLN